MTIPLTPRILGYLIEKGYLYVLAKTIEHELEGTVTITLKPLKDAPTLEDLPPEFDAYYKITQEPMQMSCGVDNTTTVVIDVPMDESIPDMLPETILEDSEFRLSEDFYKLVVESLEEYAVFTTDRLGDINSWNKGAERLLGFEEKEVIGKNSVIFFTQKDQDAGEHKKELENAINNGKAVDERYHVRKDGSVFWGSGLVFPLFDNHKVHRGFTKVMRNLDERREAQLNAPITRL
jgi:PAS domain S-box-containing protein